jgi:hypothetical protein
MTKPARQDSEIVLGILADGGPLHLILPKLVAARVLVTATSGGGKSYAIRKLLEVTANLVGPQIVIDPEGEFYTLRDRFEHLLVGRPAGRAGDIPASVKTAALLARELMTTGASAVIDLSEMDEDEQREYVREFATALVGLPRALWRPALVVIDEAQIFIAEGAKDDVAIAVRRLMTRGRKRGIATVLGTQRVSAIDKTAVAQCANVLIGQNTLDIDADRCAKALGMRAADARDVLADLEPGEFFARGPALTRKVTKCKIGLVATRHPEPGEAMPTPPPAPATMTALIQKFAAIPAEAEVEARTVEELRAQVRELEHKLRAKQPTAAAPDHDAIERAVREANTQARDHFHVQMQTVLDAVEKESIAVATVSIGTAIKAAVGTVRNLSLPPPRAKRKPEPFRASDIEPPPAAPKPAPPRRREPAAGITGPEQRIVDALAWWEHYKVSPPTLPALAFRASYSPKSSGFVKARSLCQSKGLLTSEAGGRTRITDAGRAIANDTAGDLMTQVYEMLATPEERLLRALVAHRSGLTDDHLAELGGYSPNTSGYVKARGHLCSLGLAVRVRPDWTEPAPFLFAEDPPP